MATSSRTITNPNIPVGKKTQLSLIRSKWKVKKVDTTAARDHTRRVEATATMNTGRRKGKVVLTGEVFENSNNIPLKVILLFTIYSTQCKMNLKLKQIIKLH